MILRAALNRSLLDFVAWIDEKFLPKLLLPSVFGEICRNMLYLRCIFDAGTISAVYPRFCRLFGE